MAKKQSLLKELKNSFLKHSEIRRVFSKDLVFYVGLSLLILLYFLVVSKSFPQDPGFNPQNIMQVQPSIIDQTTEELQTFLWVFIVSTIILVLGLLALLVFVKEWVWGGLLSKKSDYKRILKFLGLNITVYLISITFGLIVFGILGLIFKQIILSGTYQRILQGFAFLALMIVIIIINHFINFATYSFIKKREFVKALKNAFLSYSKTKQLLLPYLFVIIAFIIMGILSNGILFVSDNLLFQLLSTAIFVVFLSWQRVYVVDVFRRVYG